MRQVVAALIVRDDTVLICQRTKYQPMALKWEFPGGKIEPGEAPQEALRRELDEELGIQAEVGAEVARVRHTYRNGGVIELQFYIVKKYSGELENRIFKDVRWARLAELPSYDFLEADVKLIHDIAAGKII